MAAKRRLQAKKIYGLEQGTARRRHQGNVNARSTVYRSGQDLIFTCAIASPAQDAGTAVLPNNPFVVGNGRATDKDGVVRPQGKAFDLGAYEAPR